MYVREECYGPRKCRGSSPQTASLVRYLPRVYGEHVGLALRQNGDLVGVSWKLVRRSVDVRVNTGHREFFSSLRLYRIGVAVCNSLDCRSEGCDTLFRQSTTTFEARLITDAQKRCVSDAYPEWRRDRPDEATTTTSGFQTSEILTGRCEFRAIPIDESSFEIAEDKDVSPRLDASGTEPVVRHVLKARAAPPLSSCSACAFGWFCAVL